MRVRLNVIPGGRVVNVIQFEWVHACETFRQVKQPGTGRGQRDDCHAAIAINSRATVLACVARLLTFGHGVSLWWERTEPAPGNTKTLIKRIEV